MPKRCSNIACQSLVSENRPFVRVEEKVFCHSGCLEEYKKQGDLFEYAAKGSPPPYRRHHKPPKKWWETGSGF
jgi:hypothetical protein